MPNASMDRKTGFQGDIMFNLEGARREGLGGYFESLSIDGKTVTPTLKSYIEVETGKTVAGYVAVAQMASNNVLTLVVGLDNGLTKGGDKPSSKLAQVIGTTKKTVTFTGKLKCFSKERGKTNVVIDAQLNGVIHVEGGQFVLERAGLCPIRENGRETTTCDMFQLGFATTQAATIQVCYGGKDREAWKLEPPAQ